MSKHTPGAWIFDEVDDVCTEANCAWINSDEAEIKIIDKNNSLVPNAKLIAAAPDLLDSLIRLVDRIEENNYQGHFPASHRRAKQAIEKATK